MQNLDETMKAGTVKVTEKSESVFMIFLTFLTPVGIVIIFLLFLPNEWALLSHFTFRAKVSVQITTSAHSGPPAPLDADSASAHGIRDSGLFSPLTRRFSGH